MILTIDPGLNGTGWCVWTEGFKRPHEVGVINPIGTTKEKRIKIVKKFISLVQDFDVKTAYIEYPKKFGGAGGDMVANRGDLVKLTALVGYIQGALWSQDVDCYEVDVNKWKGQLPKEIVAKRVQRILPSFCKKQMPVRLSHEWDAVGIGLHLRGDL